MPSVMSTRKSPSKRSRVPAKELESELLNESSQPLREGTSKNNELHTTNDLLDLKKESRRNDVSMNSSRFSFGSGINMMLVLISLISLVLSLYVLSTVHKFGSLTRTNGVDSSEIDSLQTQISRLENELKLSKEKVDALELFLEDLADVDDRIDSLNEVIEANRANVERLKSKLEDVVADSVSKVSISKKDPSSDADINDDLDGFNSKVEKLSSIISSMQAQVASITVQSSLFKDVLVNVFHLKLPLIEESDHSVSNVDVNSTILNKLFSHIEDINERYDSSVKRNQILFDKVRELDSTMLSFHHTFKSVRSPILLGTQVTKYDLESVLIETIKATQASIGNGIFELFRSIHADNDSIMHSNTVDAQIVLTMIQGALNMFAVGGGVSYPDFAKASGGAQIIFGEGFTSRNNHSLHAVGPRGLSGYDQTSPYVAISSEMDVGTCWAVPLPISFNETPFVVPILQLSIKLIAPIQITGVTLHHYPLSLTNYSKATSSSAPKVVNVFSLEHIEDSSIRNQDYVTSGSNEVTILPICKESDEESAFSSSPNEESLSQVEISHDGEMHRFANANNNRTKPCRRYLTTLLFDPSKAFTQTFLFEDSVLSMNILSKAVYLEVLSNWGHSSHTCVYRVQVHGDPR
jgi:flagellar motility protein MotE (MotC chaperone)